MQALHTIVLSDASSPLSRGGEIGAVMLKSQPFFASAASLTALGAITAGTGFRMLPNLVLNGGTGTGAIGQAVSLKAVGTPTVGSPAGTGFANADTITLAFGVVVAVASNAGGVPLTYTLTTPGTMTAVNAPANPMPQVSSSGAGVGATVNITWGLGTAQIINSGNYSVAPAFTVTPPDGNGTGASIATGTLGGNGAAIFVGIAHPFPAAYMVQATPSVPAFASVPYKSQFGFSVALTPILAASTLAAGTVDILTLQ